MDSNKLRALLFGSALSIVSVPVMAQTTVAPGNIQQIPSGAIFVNPTGQDTFITGGPRQEVNQAPVAVANPTAAAVAQGGRGGAGGSGGGAVVTNNNTVSVPPGVGGGVGAAGYPSTIRNTPSSTLALATAYCQNNAGVSGSGPGFSFGIAGGKHDVDCIRQNYGMFLASLGMTQEAILVVANNKEVNAAMWEAHRQRQAANVMQTIEQQQPAARRVSSLNPASDGDPRPSAQQCNDMRNLADPTQIQRDYVASNCN